MPRRLWRHQDARWIRQLLPSCDNSVSLARRQLCWLKEKTNDPVTLNRQIQDRVVRHKPLQYILGSQPFGDLDIVTRPPVLIPRWETEEWVHRLIDLIVPQLRHKKEPFRVLDICTGSGCIALALASYLPNAHILATDLSTDAIDLAQHNLKIHTSLIQNPVIFKQIDVFDDDAMKLAPQFDLIVSNPPYITHSEYKSLDLDVRQWEDVRALVADEEGTAIHRRIATLANNGLLTPKQDGLPRLLMEFGGQHQVEPLRRILEPMFKNVDIWKDMAGKDRVIVAS